MHSRLFALSSLLISRPGKRLWQMMMAGVLVWGGAQAVWAQTPGNMKVVTMALATDSRGVVPSLPTKPAKPERASPALGTLVIAGGALRFDNDEIWNRIVRNAADYAKRSAATAVAAVRPASTVDRRPRIAVIAAASSDPQWAGQRIITALEKYGAAGFLVPISGPAANDKRPSGEQSSLDDNWAAEVERAHGVFFTGGTQAKLLAALRAADGQPTAVLRAIGRLHAQGGVIGGTSAGAAVMSRIMCREARDLVKVLRDGVSKGKEVEDGLGFLDKKWFVDQHFLTRGRIARALVIMQQFDVRFGLGVDEETALVVRGSDAEVIGRRGAMLIDLSQAKRDRGQPGFNLSDARISYLDGGDHVDLETREVSLGAHKLSEKPIDPQAPSFKPATNEPIVANDILANTAIFDVMKRMMENRRPDAIGMAFDGHAAQTGPTEGFEFRLSRVPGTLAWATMNAGVEDWTITGMRLDVRPVTIKGPIVAK